MTKRTLADLQSAFKTPERQSRPSNYYPFFLMPDDSIAVVRFVPDKNPDNPMGFLVEKIVHNLTINGNRRKVPCLSMFGEECPICAVSQQYYKAGDEDNGSKYWKKREHIGQALIIEDPLPPDQDTKETHEGKLRFINLGFQLFGVIKKVFESGDLDEIPFAYKGGYNFTIAKTPQGNHSNYTMGSQFARRQSDLTAEQIAYIEEEYVDLSTLLPQNPGLEKVEALLHSAMTGEDYVDPSKQDDNSGSAFAQQVQKTAAKGQATKTPALEEGDQDDDSAPWEDEKELAPTTSKAKTKAEPVAETATEAPAEDDGGTDDILAKIRNRRKKKASE